MPEITAQKLCATGVRLRSPVACIDYFESGKITGEQRGMSVTPNPRIESQRKKLAKFKQVDQVPIFHESNQGVRVGQLQKRGPISIEGVTGVRHRSTVILAFAREAATQA